MDRAEEETRPALVQAWAKGFRISDASAEFQLVVPAAHEQLDVGEQGSARVLWGDVLRPLYRLKPASLAREFAICFGEATLICYSAAHSRDKEQRPSIVVVAAAVPMSWDDEFLPVTVAAVRTLTGRLSEAYGDVFRGAPDAVQRQLQEGRFLPSRMFDLESETPDESVPWKAVVREAKRWKGVHGIATPLFLPMGANILFGTRDEAERNRSRRLDGYMDVARGEIFALSPKITPAASSLRPSEKPSEVVEESASLGSVRQQLDTLIEGQRRTQSLLEGLLELGRALWRVVEDDQPKKKKRKKD